jgi:hypothetical protein
VSNTVMRMNLVAIMDPPRTRFFPVGGPGANASRIRASRSDTLSAP